MKEPSHTLEAAAINAIAEQRKYFFEVCIQCLDLHAESGAADERTMAVMWMAVARPLGEVVDCLYGEDDGPIAYSAGSGAISARPSSSERDGSKLGIWSATAAEPSSEG